MILTILICAFVAGLLLAMGAIEHDTAGVVLGVILFGIACVVAGRVM